MPNRISRWLVPIALSAATLAAHSQPVPKAAQPDPLDAQAQVPALVYLSALGRTHHGQGGGLVDWREANDTVRRIGGWRAYAREAQQPEPAPSAPAPALAKPDSGAMPMPQGHGGHKMP